MPKGVHNKKPTALKVLRGTARPDRLPANEPKPRPVAPEMPTGLDYYSKQAWKRNAPVLERLGLLTEADADIFYAYCHAFSRYVQANRRLKQIIKIADNNIKVVRQAEVSVENAEHSLRLLANEFGLTPAARGRLNVPEVKSNEETILQKLWGK